MIETDGDFLDAETKTIGKEIKNVLESATQLFKLNNLCENVREKHSATLYAYRDDVKNNLSALSEGFKVQLEGQDELLHELETELLSTMNACDMAEHMAEITLASRGFEWKAGKIIERIPAALAQPTSGEGDTPATGGEVIPAKPATKSRGSAYLRTYSAKTHIDSIEDIDIFLEDLRQKMTEKLKDGSFDIKW